jgi:ribosomal-protein-serine acetyltransferase
MSSPTIIPEIAGATDAVEVRQWTETDAAALNTAVEQSREHLRPWMPWASDPPLSLRGRKAQIARWDSERAEGGDGIYGILTAGRIAGGGGLHRRIGVGGLETGYWLHPDFTGRGLMTQAAQIMIAAAFSMPDIARVEVHHDKANLRSGAIPSRLGFRLISEERRAPQAPGESGIECCWQITRGEWATRAAADG